ncbi:MAG: alpha-D-glucose phosphate-specific phosphoglucomutase [Proteobacteria bacterium]|nr:alpha-D-glucose phosphate-specific phosphoglucomutase [Pseudomonadota bacterium]
MKDSIKRKISPLAGKLAPKSLLINIPQLITAYYTQIPDPQNPTERVAFGTSGHRGSALAGSFNERHILAITQAIVLYRKNNNITGPLFLGMDTHALSVPAFASVMEVLAANKVEAFIAEDNEYTPTPVISHAILVYNRNRQDGCADGIVITPSHNPPQDGGIKYNPPHGGPADPKISSWIENKANEFLGNNLTEVKRISFERAIQAATTHQYDFLNPYVNDLENVLDMRAISRSGLRIGIDPMGGAGINYWRPIADRYQLNITLINDQIDPAFGFISVDWDGQIRMDPSSPYAMAALAANKNQFDLCLSCDTDHDRHGIITPKESLLPSNHFLASAIYYLYQHRPQWSEQRIIGKSVVSSQIMDAIAKNLTVPICEVPVGFKWFVQGLLNGAFGFCGEESAGAAFLRRNGQTWTTDKDGIVTCLLAAEMTAKTGKNPGEIYQNLQNKFGHFYFQRIDMPCDTVQKKLLKEATAQTIQTTQLAGEPINRILTKAMGNQAPIGGVKVLATNGWFAVRPSGTEEIYKLYAESMQSQDHLNQIIADAQDIVSKLIKGDG